MVTIIIIIMGRHLAAWPPSRGPSLSQHRRKLSLVVSGQGGRTGRAGKHRLLLSATASPFALLALSSSSKLPQNKKKIRGREWDVDPDCVKLPYSAGHGGGRGGGGIQAAFASVLANKHINSKVDNQAGQPLVLKEQLRGSGHGRCKV